MEKTGQQLLAERNQRFMDAIAMKVPDRVPIFAVETYFPAKYAGITKKAAHFDGPAWYAAWEKYLMDFEPDVNSLMITRINSGQADQALGYHQQKYPGIGLDDNTAFQFIEGEYMRAEEYDHFLDDPTDFILRVYLPRTHSAMEGLATLPPLKAMIMGAAGLSPFMLTPPFTTMFNALNQAALETAQRAVHEAEFYQRMAECGFPNFCGGLTLVPFDWISDFFRGMRGTMLDMRRCPDKLLAAQEKLFNFSAQTAIGMAQASGNPRIFIPLHRGADGFMSVKQFEEFYWPFLKRLILTLVDAGLAPMPFFEGRYDQRLEYLAQLPAGKVLCWFDRTDMAKAKEMLGDKLCIAGGMPASLLESGTVEEVQALTKKLIDVAGKDGGYIMTANTVLDEADPVLVKAWMDTTKEYGVYR